MPNTDKFIVQISGYSVPLLSVWKQTSFSTDRPTVPKVNYTDWEMTDFSTDVLESSGNSFGLELVQDSWQ